VAVIEVVAVVDVEVMVAIDLTLINLDVIWTILIMSFV
jgi:hypothetical protein